MTGERNRRVEELFQQALDRPEAERAAFLAGSGVPEEVRSEVEELLSHFADADEDFLDGATLRGEEFPSSVPDRIADYRVVRLIGSGGMGLVYEARQDHPERSVAIKVIHPWFTTASILRRFEHEVEVLGRLKHRGIAHIYDAGLEEQRPWFAMEYIVGRPLLDFARDAGLSLRQRLELLVEVLDALAHAHVNGIIHRDLKPANILVEEDGQPKILDFGIARSTQAEAEAATRVTGEGQLVGTLAYMSPEQTAGDSSDVDIRADVYAAGVLGYELLCGELPLEIGGRALPEALRIIQLEEPIPLRRRDSRVPADVETILSKALEKDRARRYGSAGEMAEDLRRYLRDEPITARPPSTVYQLRKFARRNRILVTATALGTLTLVVGTIVASWGLVRAENERDEAILARDESVALTDFFANALVAASPYRSGEGTTVAQVLDFATSGLGDSFEGSPESEAWLRLAIGSAYAGLERYEDAESNLLRARDLLAEHSGEGHPRAIACGRMLAELSRSRGDYDESQALFETTLETAERALGKGDRITLRTLFGLVILNQLQGEFELAEERARRLVEQAEAHHEPHATVTLQARYLLGNVLTQTEKLEEAEEILTEVLPRQLEHLGEEHYVALGTLESLGSLLDTLGRSQEAVPYLERARDACKRVLGEENSRTLGAELALAKVYARTGESEQALATMRRVEAIQLRAFSEDHHSVLSTRAALGAMLLETGQTEEAIGVLEQVEAAYSRVLGADHDDRSAVVGNLAEAYRRTGDLDRAVPMMEQELVYRTEAFGEYASSTLTTLNNLARARIELGQFERAEEEMTRAAELALEHFGAESWFTGGLLQTLGIARMRLEDFEGAEPVLQQSHAAFEAAVGPDHDYTKSGVKFLALLYHRWGQPEEAQRYMRILRGEE